MTWETIWPLLVLPPVVLLLQKSIEVRCGYRPPTALDIATVRLLRGKRWAGVVSHLVLAKHILLAAVIALFYVVLIYRFTLTGSIAIAAMLICMGVMAVLVNWRFLLRKD